jgi:hypothetical protein
MVTVAPHPKSKFPNRMTYSRSVILGKYLGQVAICLGPVRLMVTKRKPAQLGRYVDKLRTGYIGNWWHEIFLFCEASRPPLETIQPTVQLTTEGYFTRVKRSVREAHHSLPSSPGVKKE